MIACVYTAGTLAAQSRRWLPFVIIGVIWIWELAFASEQRERQEKRRAIAGRQGLVYSLGILAAVLISLLRFGYVTNRSEACLARLTEGETVSVIGQVYQKEFKNERYRYYLKDCHIYHTYSYEAETGEKENGGAETDGEELPKTSENTLENTSGAEILSCSRLILYLDQDESMIGDTIEAKGEVYFFESATNEGMFDLRAYYASQQIDFAVLGDRGVCQSRAKLRPGEWLYQLRCRLSELIMANMEEEEGGVLVSMLLGDKSLMDAEIKSLYQMAGISHILAISGLHVSMIGLALYRFLRRLGWRFTTASVTAGGVLLAYGAMTGNGVSTQRAIGMLLLTMAGQIFGRQTDELNSLGIVVLIILWKNPRLITYSGFDFSVMAMMGIFVCGRIFLKPWKEGDYRNLRRTLRKKQKCKPVYELILWMWEGLMGQKEALQSGFAINLAMLPLVALTYFEIPVYSIWVNLLVLPLVGLVFVSGILGLAAGLMGLSICGLFFKPAGAVLSFYQKLAGTVAQIPGALYVSGKPDEWKVIAYYLLLGTTLFGLWLLKLYQKRKRLQQAGMARVEESGKKRCDRPRRLYLGIKVWGSALLLALLLVHGKASFELDILDVGQGDGIYLCTRDGCSFFFDGGSTTVSEAGTYRILPFLKAKGLGSLDYWFVSHADADHISGIEEVLAAGYPVKYLVVSEEMPRDDAWEELAAYADAAGTGILTMQAGDVIRTQTAELTCLYPDDGDQEVFDDRNDLCLTLYLRQKFDDGREFTALLAGDLSADAEKLLVERKLIQPTSLYKVCHHGSKYSSSEELLEALQPEYAVISCGLINWYGHPSAECIERLTDSGASVYYTMYQGQISIRWDPSAGIPVVRGFVESEE